MLTADQWQMVTGRYEAPDETGSCPSGKVCHATKLAAMNFARLTDRRGGGFYVCSRCGWWHMTRVGGNRRRGPVASGVGAATRSEGSTPSPSAPGARREAA